MSLSWGDAEPPVTPVTPLERTHHPAELVADLISAAYRVQALYLHLTDAELDEVSKVAAALTQSLARIQDRLDRARADQVREAFKTGRRLHATRSKHSGTRGRNSSAGGRGTGS